MQPHARKRRRLGKPLYWLLAVLLASLAVRAEEFHPDFLSDAPLHQAQLHDAPTRSLLGLDARQLAAAGFDDRAEVELIHTYQLVAQGRLQEALQRTESLTARYPNFTLALLLQGDLQRAQAGRLRHFGDASPADDTGAAQLASLVHEAKQRLRAYAQAPTDDQLPSNFVTLAPTVHHAIAVDTSQSRLYLFQRGGDGRMHLQSDYYVTQGKLGADKQRAGDLKTPLGVYFITREVGARWLTSTYGAGALPLNYPNAWDRMLGRTGSGIWLHGVPPASYARPPLDSDGCVVLANPDIAALMTRVEPDTPVVITRHIEWLSPAELTARRATLSPLLAQAFGKTAATALYFQGQRELLVVQYDADTQRKSVTYRDYWAKDNGQWRLYHSGVPS
jgi:L,D-peptidoglycan transpeptidase YkuD (ErfK/YbiS/YcfS/YnhG family)